MLLIRSEQMKIFREDAERRFLEDVITSVSLTHGAVEGLHDRVQAAVRRAANYAIHHRDDVVWFVDLDLQRGAAWETMPGMEWALEVIDSPRSKVSGRRFRLEKRLQRWDAL